VVHYRVIGVLGSLLFPGVGLGLAGKPVRATAWAIAALATTWLVVTSVWWLPVTLIVRVASAGHAWWELLATKRPHVTAAALALAIGIGAWAGTQYALDAYRIPSESMIPTLEVGDHVYVDKLDRSAARGDIVVFRHPCSGEITIKRVAGVEGDRIALRSGVLWRNGGVIDLRGGRDFPDPGKPFAPSCGPQSKQPIGTLADGAYVVPDGGVFVMGDNRATANDSRYWGSVPASAIIGRAIGVYWPLSRAGDFE
jgi:signal peptidase I